MLSKKYSLEELQNLEIAITPGDRIYLYGDLWSGKTTLSGFLISKLLEQKSVIKSPTYVYYRKYEPNIFHFDLYRIEDYDAFVAIWWEEIFENPETICLVEWPEKIESRYAPTIKIHLQKTEDEQIRELTIERL